MVAYLGHSHMTHIYMTFGHLKTTINLNLNIQPLENNLFIVNQKRVRQKMGVTAESGHREQIGHSVSICSQTQGTCSGLRAPE